ncbi:MAG: hypothetical protein A2Y40_00655 [Candidatus Margulisbacteria bacterium GWF2_35_9]|nr:MAG: hypothetical protein A2Y40_00655 [Candidatus Margulisbacteria bacterium GWF2_35_9]
MNYKVINAQSRNKSMLFETLIKEWDLKTNNNRSHEIQLFLNAFMNISARDLVKSMMITNYTDAILTYHPDAQRLDSNMVYEKTEKFVKTIYEAIELLKDCKEYLLDFFNKISRNANPRASFWFNEYLDAYSNYRYEKKLNNRYLQLNDFIPKGSFVDIGAGGGELVKKFMDERNLGKEDAAGIDAYNWLSALAEGNITFHQLDFSVEGTTADKQYDVGTCLASIHHVGGRNEIDKVNTFIKGMSTAIKQGGILVVEEDVLVTPKDLEIEDWSQQVETLRANQPFYDQFLDFDFETQWSATTLVDFLANILSVGEPTMPFPSGFRSIHEWKYLFEENGFILKEVKFVGHLAHNFNQQSHAFFILEKQ